jgi:hypothetical protein
MSERGRVAYAIAGLAAAAVLGAAGRAEAADCSTYPNPVFISGSSASQPVLQAVAGVLGSSVSIIYQNPDSCYGLNDALTGVASTEGGTVKTNFLDPVSGAAVACTLNATTPEPVDVGVSDVFIETCQTRLNTATPPAGQMIAKINGPIQAMAIAVPTMAQGSPSISAEAAYVVFGYDATPAVGPWNTASNIFVRANTSGTLNMIGEAIGLAATKWANSGLGSTAMQQQSSTGNMFGALAGANTSPNVNATIGILAAEAVIQRNATVAAGGGTVKILPFQATGQSCGYYPDSTSTQYDKLNVRQGRYAIWGPLHFVVNVDANGYPMGPHKDAAAAVLNYFIATGDGASPMFNVPGDAGAISDSQKTMLIDAESKPLVGGVVPWCAMEVMRTSEIGAEASYQPPEPCGCHFEFTAIGKTVSPYCQTCATNDDCKNPDGGTTYYPVCRFGYCEAR